MRLYELFIIAVSLSMDAFAVSICKGLSAGRPRLGHCLTCGGWFGGFQALMPLAGWLLGVRFQGVIVSVDHWIAFVLLGLIGFNMVRESRGGRGGGAGLLLLPQGHASSGGGHLYRRAGRWSHLRLSQGGHCTRCAVHRCNHLRAVRRRSEGGVCLWRAV